MDFHILVPQFKLQRLSEIPAYAYFRLGNEVLQIRPDPSTGNSTIYVLAADLHGKTSYIPKLTYVHRMIPVIKGMSVNFEPLGWDQGDKSIGNRTCISIATMNEGCKFIRPADKANKTIDCFKYSVYVLGGLTENQDERLATNMNTGMIVRMNSEERVCPVIWKENSYVILV